MRRLERAVSLLALLDVVLAQTSLPYNPTRILRPPNKPYAYILQPAQDGQGQAQFSYVDLSKTFAASAGATSTISQTVPFLQDAPVTPYTAMVDANGNVTAITGNCTQGSQGVKIWRYAGTSGPDTGTWTQFPISSFGPQTQGEQAGANFLAEGVAFSQFTTSDPSDTNYFIFGGMCPSPNTTTESWLPSASYSNLMLSLTPASGDVGASKYNIDLALSRGPPIAEAGFTMTGLSPAFSANTTGQPQTQQQTFVLVGGHTQTAFINMSQVALWSLPQQGWTFLPVSQPGQNNADLSRRQQSTIEPRSGHASVLSEDGQSIYVIGGWVGDVNTPAKPQVAKLSVGSGYGGSGNWIWSVPSAAEKAPFGNGIYGHGAAMLPGGIIMVAGGRQIGASSRTRRAVSTSQFFLYNATANAWVDSYTPPANMASSTDSGPLSKTSQQAGLGAGLGIGCAVVVGLFAFYLWYSKRLKRARETRERELLTHSSTTSFNNTDRAMLERGGVVEQNDAPALGRFWTPWENRGYANIQSGRPQMSGPTNPMQTTAGSTALFMNAPSPTRGLRKNLSTRPYQYQAAPRWDDPRSANRRSGVIHPIAELENEDGTESQASMQNQETLSDAERKLRELERVLGSPHADPFIDPSSNPNPLGSHPVSPDGVSPIGVSVQRNSVTRKPVPSSALLTDAHVASSWLAMGHDHDSPYDQAGRESPARTEDRTLSSLSEASQTSYISSDSNARTMSATSGALLAAAAARSTSSRGGSSHGASSSSNSGTRNNRTRSSTNGSQEVANNRSGTSDSDSFMTASTNFTRLRSEGQNLLGGRNAALDRDDPYQRAMAAIPPSPKDNVNDDEFPLTRPRKRGWMGSLRRALNAVAMGDRTFSLTGSNEAYTDSNNTAASSPTKEKSEENFHSGPRRTVSEGGALLRGKRGQKDWNDNEQFPPYRDDPEDNDWGHPRKSSDGRQAEEEWDVEGAVAKRDVQVMFSVPKARLRVVNADMDRVSLRSASDGALSRTESMKRKEDFAARHETRKIVPDYTFEEYSDDESNDGRKKAS